MLAALAPRRLGVHLLAIVLVAAAIGLGLWQLHAWQLHRAAAAADRTHVAPVALGTLIGPDDPFPGDRVGRPVTVSGTWVPSATVYVSGREYDGRDGYWAVTPVAVGDSPQAPAIPVVRGWVSDPAQAPAPPSGTADLTGWLQPPEGTGQTDPNPRDDVLPQLRIADLIQHVDQDLYGAYVVDRTAPAGLEQASPEQLPGAGAFTALRNLLYAIEWWFFGAFAAFVWWRWLQEEVLAPDAPAEVSGVGG